MKHFFEANKTHYYFYWKSRVVWRRSLHSIQAVNNRLWVIYGRIQGCFSVIKSFKSVSFCPLWWNVFFYSIILTADNFNTCRSVLFFIMQMKFGKVSPCFYQLTKILGELNKKYLRQRLFKLDKCKKLLMTNSFLWHCIAINHVRCSYHSHYNSSNFSDRLLVASSPRNASPKAYVSASRFPTTFFPQVLSSAVPYQTSCQAHGLFLFVC